MLLFRQSTGCTGNAICSPHSPGMVLSFETNGKNSIPVKYRIKDILEDIESGRTKHQVALQVMIDAANQQMPYLRFTGEVEENDLGIPVLDTRITIGTFQGGAP